MYSASREPSRRILIIRPSALGDVARTVPCLVSLRAAYPGAHIDWLVEQGSGEVIRYHPALSGVVSFPKKAIKAAAKRLNFGPFLAFRKQLRAANYDAVFDLQGLARSAAMAFATRAPRRYGLATARELGWLAYTHKAAADIQMHTVERMLEVVRAAGVEAIHDMRLYTPPPAMGWLSTQPVARSRYAVLAPTSRWAGKQWPAARFAAVARHLLAHGVEVAIVGGKNERDQCEPLLELARAEKGVHDYVGGTDIGQLMALIEGSALTIANDSAALHMAVGFDRPLVALFGPTRVSRVGPYRREGDVVQHVTPADPMDHKDSGSVMLMERISIVEVIAMADARLGS